MKKAILKAMVLCIVMILTSITVLFTTTYSWFVDSQESVDNTINAGALDAVVEAQAADGSGLDLVTGKIIEETNWQPSDKDAVAITVRNNGTIDLKFDLNLTVVDPAPATDLSPVIWYVWTADADKPTALVPYVPCDEPAEPAFFGAYVPVTGVTLAAGAEMTYRLDYGFLTSAGNTYQSGVLNITVNVQAYQTMQP
jgi:hypothetical protein